MKKILMPVLMGMTARNILRGPVLRELQKHFKIIIASPWVADKKFVEEFTDDNIECRPFVNPRGIKRILAHVLYHWQYYAFWRNKHPATIKKYIRRDKEKKFIRKYIWGQAGGFVVNLIRKNDQSDFMRSFIYDFDLKQAYPDIDAIFLFSTDVIEDQIYLFSAQKQKIPVITLVHSWDNLPSRGLLPTLPDKLLVWNDIMKEQAISLHNVPKKNIHVVGVPQFETYKLLSMDDRKQEFLEKFKIENNYKIITYTGSAERVFPDEPEFIEWVIKNIKNGVFGEKVHLIFRVHPTERKDYYLKKYLHTDLPVSIDVPDAGFVASYTEDVGANTSIKDFIDLMRYSSVVINLASTISIDAAFFDTPVCNIAFNFNVQKDEWNSAPLWYLSSHFTNIKKTGGTLIAETPEQLREAVNYCIREPEALKTKRERITREQITYKIPSLEITKALKSMFS